MLSISSDGVVAIHRLLASTERRAGAVLRIVLAQAGQHELALALSRPRQTDLVVCEHGIRLYFGPELASRLDGKLLDARVEADGVRLLVR